MFSSMYYLKNISLSHENRLVCPLVCLSLSLSLPLLISLLLHILRRIGRLLPRVFLIRVYLSLIVYTAGLHGNSAIMHALFSR